MFLACPSGGLRQPLGPRWSASTETPACVDGMLCICICAYAYYIIVCVLNKYFHVLVSQCKFVNCGRTSPFNNGTSTVEVPFSSCSRNWRPAQRHGPRTAGGPQPPSELVLPPPLLRRPALPLLPAWPRAAPSLSLAPLCFTRRIPTSLVQGRHKSWTAL